jgi:16S rRNA (cytosine1402-N4)-methyltransferase
MGILMILHKSVLLNECINNLHIKSDGIYVDATLGYGGHSEEILKRLKTGYLYCFDQDIEAIKNSQERLSKVGNNFKIIKSNFANITEKLIDEGINKVDGIIFDLGVSSPQLDNGERGFSYHKDAILDMRMDKDNELDAKYVVNKYEYNDLVRILRDYGDEKYAPSIANNIIKYRQNKEIETTLELVDIIKKSMPARELRDGHPAKRTFQAIRIHVNHELEVLSIALEKSIKLLKVGGRLCVISFHSKEDSIVKKIFKKYSEVDASMKNLPFIPEEYSPKIKVVESNITASASELEENNRARSAKLRVIEKIRK